MGQEAEDTALLITENIAKMVVLIGANLAIDTALVALCAATTTNFKSDNITGSKHLCADDGKTTIHENNTSASKTEESLAKDEVEAQKGAVKASETEGNASTANANALDADAKAVGTQAGALNTDTKALNIE